MNKTFLKQLIITSYKKNELNQDRILKIADRLNRKDLKKYIKGLRMAEKIRTVIVETPIDENIETKRHIQKIYADKKVVFKKNPTLMVGSKITDNDDIVEMNLRNSLESIVESIGENYD